MISILLSQRVIGLGPAACQMGYGNQEIEKPTYLRARQGDWSHPRHKRYGLPTICSQVPEYLRRAVTEAVRRLGQA